MDIHAGTGLAGALFTVHPVTGNRTILSDFGDLTQGPTGVDSQGIALHPSGAILVTDHEAGTGGLGALFVVDRATGARTLLSDFGDASQGPTGHTPVGVAVDASGAILVTDLNAGTGALGALFAVDPATGARTILSDFGDGSQGPAGSNPLGIAVAAGGTILVIDFGAGTGGFGALFTVDPATGTRTILSDFGDATQGPTGADPGGLALAPSGTILVIDAGARALFTVNPTTGARTILSDFANPIKGPTAQTPIAVAVFPGGAPPPDPAAPETSITTVADGKRKPKPIADGSKTSSTGIQFTFAGSDDVGVSHFECSLDGAPFSACSSPISYVDLDGGTHTFQVRAVDTSGNPDPTPETFSWFVSGHRRK
jgi:hypothetical protein